LELDMTTPSTRATPWNVDAGRGLGMTTDVETAAQTLGIGRSLAYELMRKDEFPVRLIRLHRRVLIPIADLLKLLGATAS
jgi:hypothetical protein